MNDWLTASENEDFVYLWLLDIRWWGQRPIDIFAFLYSFSFQSKVRGALDVLAYRQIESKVAYDSIPVAQFSMNLLYALV